VIVQNEPFLSSLPTVQIVPFTSQPDASRFPGTLLVQPVAQNGLTLPSVVWFFNMDLTLIDRALGSGIPYITYAVPFFFY